MIIIKSDRELEKMRAAGRLAAECLWLVAAKAAPGVTTGELDRAAEDFIVSSGGTPSFQGYRGFPASICASINSEVVHGIPGSRELKEGDLLSIDVGAIVGGYHGDNATTVPIGEVSEAARELLRAGEGALFAGIEKTVAGNRLSDISHAVQTYAESRGYSVVRSYTGHGIGRQMHEAPDIPNFGPPGLGPRLRKGMVLAIEPMLNEGGHAVEVADDGWTVYTADRGLSVHFEHTVAVTDEGWEILTRCG